MLAAERARKRRELLDVTEKELARIRAAVARKRDPLRGKDRIGVAVGEVIGQHKMVKYFDLTIEDASFSFTRSDAKIAAEAALDGLYVIRTNLPKEAIGADDAVSAYKNLAQVDARVPQLEDRRSGYSSHLSLALRPRARARFDTFGRIDLGVLLFYSPRKERRDLPESESGRSQS